MKELYKSKKVLLEDSLHRLVWLWVILVVLLVLGFAHLMEDNIWCDALAMVLLVMGNVLIWNAIWPIFDQVKKDKGVEHDDILDEGEP